MSKQEVEVLEGEVILAQDEGGAPGGRRTLRVYDKARGDFLIEIPSEARLTFGYFNPAASGDSDERYGGMGGRGSTTMKTTCLRVYADGTDKRQIAAYLGVDGFRDQDLVKLTRLTQKVTIETNFEDDGLGKQASSALKQLGSVPVNEDEAIF